MPYLLFGSGLDTSSLRMTRLGGEYGQRTRWYDVGADAVLDGRAHLVRLFEAAARHDCYVILSSWEYQQSPAFLADSSWSDALLAVPPAERPLALADALASMIELQPGWQDINDAVQNARDAKARGMKVFLSFHYSDFWTNPGAQLRPVAWHGYSQSQLEKAIYDYTVSSLRAMKGAGVTPEFVSIGNEINNGLADVSRWDTPAQYFALLRSASAAVRAASPTSKIVIHLTMPDKATYAGWIAGAQANGLDYDVMGVSLYPFWTDMSIASLSNFSSWVGTANGKPVMVCETGYPWTLDANGANERTLIQENGLDPDGPGNYGATPTGQLTWMREYIRAMYETGRVAGISYWDPINIDFAGGADPNGWVVGGDNAVEDTTFFDYSPSHRALPGLTAFRTW